MTENTELKDVKSLLEKLARLGNEPHLGNSDGNIIAQRALASLNKHQERMNSEELVQEVAKSIWEECQGISYCGKQAYNVDPTKDESRQLAKAAIQCIQGISK